LTSSVAKLLPWNFANGLASVGVISGMLNARCLRDSSMRGFAGVVGGWGAVVVVGTGMNSIGSPCVEASIIINASFLDSEVGSRMVIPVVSLLTLPWVDGVYEVLFGILHRAYRSASDSANNR